jgi:hypothetical protein
MTHRRNVKNRIKAHVNGPQKEHDTHHGNKPTGELQAASTRKSCITAPSPTHPPSDVEGVADVGGVIGQKTRDTDYTRYTGGAISAERLEAVAATGLPGG